MTLGALFCIWGAVAMLTSAPFDDWWHNTYGLDIVILSPPHTLLALGMLFLMFGSCVSISKHINLLDASGNTTASGNRQGVIYQLLFVMSAASLLCMSCTLLTEYLETRSQHQSSFYQIAAATVLLFLPAFSKALRMKWGMSSIAIGYFIILGVHPVGTFSMAAETNMLKRIADPQGLYKYPDPKIFRDSIDSYMKYISGLDEPKRENMLMNQMNMPENGLMSMNMDHSNMIEFPYFFLLRDNTASGCR